VEVDEEVCECMRGGDFLKKAEEVENAIHSFY
jgi:hypothetical protein